MSPPVALQLAKAATASLGDGPPLPLAPKDAALLAWLALEGPTARNRLATLLWPLSATLAARNTLRQRLFQLKKQFGDALVTGQSTLALAPNVTHDLEEADDVLAGDTPAVGGEFEAWLLQQRARRRLRTQAALAELAEMAERARDWPSALAHAQELLALEPLAEDAHRRLMRLHYLAGDRAAAMLAFDACERVLKHEVGTQPSGETLALLATIEQSSAAPAPPAGARAATPASVLRPPRLIGRDAEWQALLQCWQAQAQVVLVGEAGMGKTRLVADLAQHHKSSAVLTRAHPGDDAVPYALLGRLLRALLARSAQPPLPAHQRELARLLPEFGDPPPADATRALALRDALEAVLAQAQAAGVAGVLLDDLHHADRASIESIKPLWAMPRPLAWVMACRGAELGPAARELVQQAQRHPGTRTLTLQPLGTGEIAALVDSLGLRGLQGAQWAPPLMRHTGGNPMYLLETLKAMLQQGGPQAVDQLPAAANVLQLIGQRLAGLSPQALKLARCAAIAGQDFAIELATRVLGAGPLDLADAWAELEAAQVFSGTAFAHDLIHEAARATVPAALARRLHALVADSLTALGAAVQRVAAHWVASDTPHLGVPSLLATGRLAARALRPQEAHTAFVQAADLLQAQGREPQARQALLELLEVVYSPAGEEVQAVLERLDTLARTPAERAEVAERRCDVLARSGDFASSGRLAQQALAALDARQSPALAAKLLCAAAAGDLAGGQHDAAVERLHRATDLAARSGDEQAECTTAMFFGSVLDHAHRHAEAYLAHRRALDLTQRREQPMELISVAANIAGNRTQMGLFDAALEMIQLCWKVAGERAGDGPGQEAIDIASLWPSLQIHHAYTLFGLGDYTQALRLFDDAHADFAQRMPAWLPAVHNMQATLWMHLGQWARARQAVAAALQGSGAALPRYHARALQLQAEINAALREAPAPLQAPASAPEGAGPAAQHQLALSHTLALGAEAGYALACRLRADALARQMPNQVLEAETRCAATAARLGLHEQAAAHAREALRRLHEATPTAFYRGEVWLAAAEALAATAPEERAEVLKAAAAWIRDTAEHRVPPEFRDSFLRRNPVNRSLLAAAGAT